MDYELLFALLILWTSTTTCLVLFVLIVFNHDGGAFHPHCVDVESRHYGFIVVKSCTTCKTDCAVKSISAFIAPRGSSSSKYFGSIIVIISVAGMFGCFRWFMIGDADETQAILSVLGFSFLLLICAFESDVSPDRFLEDKLMVTAWYLERLGAESLLDFPLDEQNGSFRYFVRTSPRLRPLFEEFDRDEAVGRNLGAKIKADEDFPYRPWWAVVHMVGALAYLGCVAASIILNDVDDTDIYGVAYVMVASFALFSAMGYLTGTYVPLLRPLRGLVLVWNPFCRDRDYLTSLREAVIEYKLAELGPSGPSPRTSLDTSVDTSVDTSSATASPALRRRSGRRVTKSAKLLEAQSAAAVDSAPGAAAQRRAEMLAVMEREHCLGDRAGFLVRPILDFIQRDPYRYLRYTSAMFVVLELIAMLTPAVAIGLQWATALCPGPPMQSILELAATSYSCQSMTREQCEALMRAHCIMG